MHTPAKNLTKWQLIKLLAVLVLVLALFLNNIKYQPLEQALQPIFNRSLYPISLYQRWNMFTGEQTDTFALRVQSMYVDGRVSYNYSNMGQKPYLWPNKQRNLEWGLAKADYSGLYRLSYLRYLCKQDPNLARVTYQSAPLPLPTVQNPDYDPFVDAPHFLNLASVGCK